MEDKNALTRDFSIAEHCLKRSCYNGECLRLFTYYGAGNESDVNWIQKELCSQMGIEVSVHFLPYKELHQQRLVDKADMVLGEQLIDENLFYTYLSAFKGNHSLIRQFLSDSFLNEIDILIQSKSEYNLLNSFKELEAQICREYGFIHLYRLQQFAIYSRNLQGIHINAWGWVDYTKLWYKYE
ncbi:hypothetical protein [Salinibacillus kushneri]|uniref:hypothetical protein n=1 Tax=Salinibacillus kushneri TaxID=237682 RepID=UPI0015A63111|nr:hypothetical protein [Salinibacillus kushneri]